MRAPYKDCSAFRLQSIALISEASASCATLVDMLESSRSDDRLDLFSPELGPHLSAHDFEQHFYAT